MPMDDEKQKLHELTSDEVRRIGIALNGGKAYGWRDRLASLTGASAYTIRSWADNESSASHRPCTGPAAVLLQILSALNARHVDVDAFLKDIAQANPKDSSKPGLVR